MSNLLRKLTNVHYHVHAPKLLHVLLQNVVLLDFNLPDLPLRFQEPTAKDTQKVKLRLLVDKHDGYRLSEFVKGENIVQTVLNLAFGEIRIFSEIPYVLKQILVELVDSISGFQDSVRIGAEHPEIDVRLLRSMCYILFVIINFK